MLRRLSNDWIARLIDRSGDTATRSGHSDALLYPATTHNDMDDHSHEPDPDERVTSPMQGFGSREVGIGAAVTLIGLLIAYVIPFLFTF